MPRTGMRYSLQYQQIEDVDEADLNILRDEFYDENVGVITIPIGVFLEEGTGLFDFYRFDLSDSLLGLIQGVFDEGNADFIEFYGVRK